MNKALSTIAIMTILLSVPGVIRAQHRMTMRQDPSDVKIISGANEAVLPFTLRNNHLILEIELNGQRLSAIFDSGMPIGGLLLTGESEDLDPGLDYTSQVPVGGAGGGAVMADLAQGATITVGQILLENQTVIALPPVAEKRLHVDAVIGYALFGRFAVEIDYIDREIVINEPAAFTPGPDFTEIPLDLRGGFPFASYSITQFDGSEIDLTTIVDLGASAALMLFPEVHESINRPAKSMACRIGRGASHDIEGYVGRIRNLQLGPFNFNNVVASFDAGEPSGPAMMSPDGNLGAEILKRFDVTMDYSNSRMLLRPNEQYDNPFEFNMAGIQISTVNNGSFRIDRILPGSSAEKAGLQAGDIIFEVNGIPAKMIEISGFVDRLRSEEGTVYTLAISRNGELTDYRIILERLI